MIISKSISGAAVISMAIFSAQAFAVEVPAEVTLSNLTQVYDGTGKLPTVASNPSGLSVELGFAEPEPVFSNFPSALPLSTLSLAFAAQKTFGLGDYLQMASGGRDLMSVDTALVTWAKAANYPTLAAANPDGWYHPVTVSIYSMGAGGALTFVGESTEDVFIPWRPLTLPNGNPYPYNGFAFRAHVPFPPGVVIPDEPVVLVSFNTQSTGFAPIGSPGPYNELNMAVVGNPPSIGADKDSAAVLWVREDSWAYPTSGTPTPLFEVVTSGISSTTPPVNAGDYRVTATITEPGYDGSVTEDFTILPAPVTIELTDLIQIEDGSPKSATATSTPSGVPLLISYPGSAGLPTSAGTYPVEAEVNDSNYTGSTSGTLVIGYEYLSWMTPKVSAGDVPVEQSGKLDDFDLDGILNVMEYALGLNPAVPFGGAGDPEIPYASSDGGEFSLVYRRNLLATELQFDVYTTETPDQPATWQPTATTDVILSTVDNVQTIRAIIPVGANVPRLFARLGIR